MSDWIREAIKGLDNPKAQPAFADEATRENIRKRLQAECFHRARPLAPDSEQRPNADGHRYYCVDCGKRLKVLSGVLIREDSHGPDKPR